MSGSLSNGLVSEMSFLYPEADSCFFFFSTLCIEAWYNTGSAWVHKGTGKSKTCSRHKREKVTGIVEGKPYQVRAGSPAARPTASRTQTHLALDSQGLRQAGM